MLTNNYNMTFKGKCIIPHNNAYIHTFTNDKPGDKIALSFPAVCFYL